MHLHRIRTTGSACVHTDAILPRILRMKTLFAVVLCAAFSGVIVTVFLRVLGVDSGGVIGAEGGRWLFWFVDLYAVPPGDLKELPELDLYVFPPGDLYEPPVVFLYVFPPGDL